jgi:polyisoprenoid-binding protein YceI
MKRLHKGFFRTFIFFTFFLFILSSCTHDDEILASKGPDIIRGTEKVTLTNPATSFDKSHSNVGWETLYLGSTAILTGRFNSFGFNSFEFDESTPTGISFDAWVWLNSVNTGEPGRDDGCLIGTYGTDNAFTTETANLATIKTKSVELSTTDKGYNVKADLTFHGVTKEITGKLSYDGKTQITSAGVVKDVLGFSFSFQFLAKTDFGIQSNNIGDNVTIKCNAVIRRTI